MRILDMRPAFRGGFGERREPPRIIILHHTQTASPDRTRRVLSDRGLSTHVEVDRAGDVLLYLDPATDTAWHAGTPNNAPSIGIDATHMQGQSWPAAQLEALAWIVGHYAGEFGIPLVTAPDRCVIAPEPGCQGPLSTAPELVAMGYGVGRHRNVKATECPDDLPVEDVVRRALGGRPSSNGLIAPVLAAAGGFLAWRAWRKRAA